LSAQNLGDALSNSGGGGHGGGLRFVAGAAGLGAEEVGGDELGDLMEPRAEGGFVEEGGGFLGEGEEDGLGGVFGEGGVAEAEETDGVEPGGVALDEQAEGRLGVLGDELVEELLVVHFALPRVYTRWEGEVDSLFLGA
jgi:hypothetical protein